MPLPSRPILLVGCFAAFVLSACHDPKGDGGPTPVVAQTATSTRPPTAPMASGAPRTHRAKPVCAVQDCATGKMIDDGCSDDGQCASCVNLCDPPPH